MKHSVAYRARRQRMRHNRRMRDINRNLDEFGRQFRERLSRQEQLEGMAERGCDTWRDYREEN